VNPSLDAVDQSELIRSDVDTGTSIAHSCLRCGHHWTPKDQSRPPRCCSLCRSAYWDSPAAGSMTDEERSAAQAKIREKVAARAALARRKTAERKLVRWAQEVGPGSLRVLMRLFDPVPERLLHQFTPEEVGVLKTVLGGSPAGIPPTPKFETEEAYLEHAVLTHGKATVTMPPAGMPPPPKFEDER
jgi:hypothetical protein